MTALITVCRSARLMPAAYQFYCAILRRFPARGGPPDHTQLRQLARRFAVPLAATLADMAAQDLIQLDATTGGIRAAYPFSGLPTPHRVLLAPDAQEVAEQQVFAMCALDALGIPLMLHRAATILSEDALTHMPIQVTIEPAGHGPLTSLDGWRARWDPVGMVIFARDATHEHEHDGGCAAAGTCCPVTNFFTQEAHAQQWAQLHPVSDGIVLTPVEALHRAQALFGGVLQRLEVQRP
jgi:hypothetical protein